jgi:hypothetical protein
MLPLVARTTEVPGDEPAVNSPELVMVPPPLAIDQTGVIVTVLPAASFPTAENCSVPAVAMVWLSGLTTIVASGPAVTVTFAVRLTSPLAAFTVAVPGAVPAVKSPELVMVPLPLVTDHVGVKETVFPWASFPTAVNCRVPEMERVSLAGATVMLASAPLPPDTPVGGAFCLAQRMESIPAAVAPATTRQTVRRSEGDMAKH